MFTVSKQDKCLTQKINRSILPDNFDITLVIGAFSKHQPHMPPRHKPSCIRRLTVHAQNTEIIDVRKRKVSPVFNLNS